MCGIYGQLNFTAPAEPGAHLPAALAALTHRGPDEEGSWCNDRVALGMRRLSIIDLAGGQQPIWNEDRRCCIVYNGELYNYLDLRPTLQARGHRFRTQSDTEVILHAYEEWGVDCLQRLNGMFALAIWNERTQTLLLARDRIGEKPLYYYEEAGQRLLFGSEIKALLTDPTVPREVDLGGLRNFLTFGHAVAPKSIYRGINKLLPGHYLLARNGRSEIRQYWDVERAARVAGNGTTPANVSDPEQYITEILTLLDDSVRRRMIADVPVGAFLSGGVDSSAVVALMQHHTDTPIKTFSLGFQADDSYNELSDARRVAAHFGTEHHELQVTHIDLIETLHTLIHHYDEPFGDPAGFPVYLLSQLASQQVKVVLTGDGGDELFGGYRRYVADQAAGLYQRLPAPLIQRWIPALAARLPRSRSIKQLAQTLAVADPAERYATWLTLFTPQMQANLLQPAFHAALTEYDPVVPFRHDYRRFADRHTADHLNQLMYIDLKRWLADVYMEKTDKATMACGLEARLPLLDHRLVELAFQMPSRYKIRGGETKYLFKRAIHPLIPAFVLKKPKHGFSVPIDPWFRGELRDYAFTVLLDPAVRRRGYFNVDFIEQLWREHSEGKQVWDIQLWLLLNFELWHNHYLDGIPA